MSEFEHTRPAEYAILAGYFPGRAPEPIGILLRDVDVDRLYVRIRNEWWLALPDESEPEIWADLAQDLEQKARELGGERLLTWLETNASHAIQLVDRQAINIHDVDTCLAELYTLHVPAIQEIRTEAASTDERSIDFQPVCSANSRSLQDGFRKRSTLIRWMLAASGLLILYAAATQLNVQKKLPNRSPAPITGLPSTNVAGALPGDFLSDYNPALLNLNLPKWVPFSRPKRNPRRHKAGSNTRPFRGDRLTVRLAFMPKNRIETCPLQVTIDIMPTAALPQSLTPVVQQFRRTHSPFIRFFLNCAMPFKKLHRKLAQIPELISD